MKKWIFPSLFTVLLVTGCQAGNDEAYDLRQDTNNPNFMSNTASENRRSDRDMGQMSDQNPNFLNLRGTTQNGESSRNNMGKDIDVARSIVNDSRDFQSQSIWISNDQDHMTVVVDYRGSGNEYKNAKARLHKKLMQALPRYSIEIRER